MLIEGESGCGKELVVPRKLEANRVRHSRKNCAAISPTLIEPALFGHSKGDHRRRSAGKVSESARRACSFLDEIGELPLESQQVRVLETARSSACRRNRNTQARVIAATNRNLRDAVKTGTSRGVVACYLGHHLNVFSILVPPLRGLGGTNCCCSTISVLIMRSNPNKRLLN